MTRPSSTVLANRGSGFGEVAGDLDLEPNPSILGPRVERRVEVWLLDESDVRMGVGGCGTSGGVTPAPTRTFDALSMYVSMSFSLFHFRCRSSNFAVSAYGKRKTYRTQHTT